MRLITLLAVFAIFAFTAKTSNAQITNYEVSGNLEAKSSLGCVPLSTITNKQTPADIYPGVAACIKSSAYQKAVLLFAVAGTFGYFDQLRVTDSTARQAVMVIEMKDFGSLTSDQKKAFKTTLLATLDPRSPSLKSICSAVGRLGPPKYFPSYMVQHGMSAFLGNSGSGVKANFDAAQGWRDSLTGFLRCP